MLITIFALYSTRQQKVIVLLGEKLKEIRESKGILQRQVAAELDVDTAPINKWKETKNLLAQAR